MAYIFHPDDMECVSTNMTEDMKEFCENNSKQKNIKTNNLSLAHTLSIKRTINIAIFMILLAKKLYSYELGGRLVNVYEIEEKLSNATTKSTVTVFSDNFEVIASITENLLSTSTLHTNTMWRAR